MIPTLHLLPDVWLAREGTSTLITHCLEEVGGVGGAALLSHPPPTFLSRQINREDRVVG